MRSLAQSLSARIFTLLFCGLFMEESVFAQTATSPNSGSIITSSGSGQYTLSWWAQPNLYYLIQQSPDFTNWQFLPMIDAGSGGLLSYGINTTAPKLFFRLKAESNPFATYSNGVSEPDGYLALNSMGPGGMTYLQQFLQSGPGKTGAPNRLGNGGNSTQTLSYGPGSGTAIGTMPTLDLMHDPSGAFFPSQPALTASRDLSDATTCDLNWTVSNENVTAITLEKRVGGTGLWQTLATPVTTATSYEDTGLVAGITYEYRLVVAYQSGITFTSINAYYQVPLFDFEVGTRSKSSSAKVPGVPGFIDTAPPRFYLVQTTGANAPGPGPYPDYTGMTSGNYSETTTYSKFSATNPEGDASPTHSGSSSATDDETPPVTASATEHADGTWTDDTTGFLTSPYYFGTFGFLSPSSDAQATSNEDGTTTVTLTQEYTPQASAPDFAAAYPAHIGDWQSSADRDYGIDLNSLASPLIFGSRKNGFTDAGYYSGQYQLYGEDFQITTNPSVSQAIAFYYEFDPTDTSLPASSGPLFTVPALPTRATATYSLNAATTPSPFVGTSVSGSYSIHCLQLAAGAAYLDASTKLGVDSAPLDVNAMSAGTGIVQAPNFGDKDPLYGTIHVITTGSFKITGGSGFTIYADSVSVDNIVPNNTIVPAGQGAAVYLIVPNASAADGAKLTVTVTLLDSTGTALGSQSVSFTNRRDVQPQDYSVGFSEATGARYRKIGLNGRPLADEKPQQTAESDSEKEESYIDSLNLTLHHSVTDVRVKIPGSDLALQVRRNTASEVWDMHNGFRPHERLDRPFGAGWNSNLCVYADTQTTADGISYTYIIDQNGDSHRFLNVPNPGVGTFYVPLPSDSRENSDYLTSFDGTTFIDRYGTKIVFSGTVPPITSTIASDRYQQSGFEAHTYARASTITDRFGYRLTYTYPAGVNTLIPSSITWTGGQQQAIAISQDSGHVTDVWDPNGNHFQYTYKQQAYTFNNTGYTAPVLQTVTLPTSDTIQYDVNLFQETDTTPLDITNGQASDQYHIDVNSLTDPSGNKTTFAYHVDQTRLGYDLQSHVYYPLCGAPMSVTGITLPGGGSVTLANQSTVKLAVDAAGHLLVDSKGNPSLTGDSVRKNVITDAAHNVVTYTFSDGLAMNAGGIYNTPLAAVPKIVFYKTMQASFKGSDQVQYGAETYTFNLSAGLALESVVDLSGNTTSYSYGDNYNAAVPLSSVLPITDFDSVYPDPTTQTDTAGQVKTFTYGTFQAMSSILDENNHYRSYMVDGMGRRGNEIIYAGATAAAPIVQETDFSYDGTFSGVMTGKTIKKQPGDPAWAGDLVTQDILDGNGHVKKHIVDPAVLALTTQYTYDPNGNKLTEIDPNGHTTSYEYDSLDRPVKVVFPDGSDKTYEYYPNSTLKSETDESQHTTTYTYDGLRRRLTATRMVTVNGVLIPETVTYVYSDAVNPKSSVTDANNHTTTYEYDGLQRLRKVHDPYQNLTQYDYNGPNSGASAFDSSGFRPTTVTDAAGYVTTNTYDQLYRLTNAKRQYQLQTQAQPALYSNIGYGYDAVGNRTSGTDDNRHTTTTYYDFVNRPYHVVYADTHDIFFNYTGTGLAYYYKDELGSVTTTQFDGASRPVYVYEPPVDDGLNPSDPNRAAYFKTPTTQTVYDSNGNVTAKIITNLPVSEEWDYQYDVRNRKIVEQQPAVTDAETGAQNVRPTLQWGYDYVGNLLWQQDARDNATVMTYDEANHRLTTTQPFVWVFKQNAAVQPVTTNTYDPAGNLVNVQDPNGNITVNTFDNLNRLTKTTDAFGNYVAYGYDTVGNITSENDAWTSWTMSFDGLHRQTALIDQTNVSTAFTYDGVNRTARTDGNQQTTHYGYDARNRLASVTYPAARANDNQTHTYDFASNLTSVTLAGYNTAADVHYAYDACHRLTSETSNGATHSYRLDLAGNRLGVQYGANGGGSGRLLTCTFDNLNRPSTMSEGGRTTTYGYDLNGNVTTKTLPSGEVVTTAHDALNRAFTEHDLSPTGLLYTYLWLHDADGNLCYSSNLTAGVPNTTFILSYDTANRLTGEVQLDPNNATLSSISYGYDGSSNRTQKSVTQGGATVTTTYTYNHLDQLTGWSDTNGNSASYSYDSNGNCASQTTGALTDTYGFDDETRLISVTKNTPGNVGSYSYIYDYRSRRVSRTEPATGTTSIVFSGGTSVQEYTGGTLTVDYVRGSNWGGGVGGILYSMRGTTPSFAHYNSRGDIVAHTNISGGLTYQATYDAEGTHAIEVGSTPDRQKANTKEEDPTGLKFEGKRYTRLDSLTFLTRDPAGLIDGPNVYCYCHASPWTAFDPEGLATEDERHCEAQKYAGMAEGLEKKAQVEEKKARDNYWGNLNAYKSAESARKTADDARNRADILSHGTQGDYRQRVVCAYGENNPDLNRIMAYYADQFNDINTLEFLSKQHPAPQPSMSDLDSIALTLILPESALEAPGTAETTVAGTTTAGNKPLTIVNCFPAGTLVSMADGTTKAIESVKEGDLVLTADCEHDGAGAPEPVLKLNKDIALILVRGIFETEDGETIEISATSEHPFWTQDSGWKYMADLKSGDRLLSSKGATIRLVGREWIPGVVDTYNLTVKQSHTFYVGDGHLDVLVHNVDNWDMGTMSSPTAAGFQRHEIGANAWYEANGLWERGDIWQVQNPMVYVENSLHGSEIQSALKASGVWYRDDFVGMPFKQMLERQAAVISAYGAPDEVVEKLMQESTDLYERVLAAKGVVKISP